jgi:hypothetical protein
MKKKSKSQLDFSNSLHILHRNGISVVARIFLECSKKILYHSKHPMFAKRERSRQDTYVITD